MSTPLSETGPAVQTLATLDDMRERIRKKSQLKGRQADEASLREVRALIGAAPYRRDLLIEHLHQLNDAYRGLHERHLTALAKAMNLPLAEVYEVATFYHHVEVLRGDDPGPALTLRAQLFGNGLQAKHELGVGANELTRLIDQKNHPVLRRAGRQVIIDHLGKAFDVDAVVVAGAVKPPAGGVG